MPQSRPDFAVLASRLDLDRDADPFEVLARTGGRRVTDRIEVFAPPELSPAGESTMLFLVRGIRDVPGAGEAVATLAAGDRLVIADQPDNEFNLRVVIVEISDGRQIGWVPDYLVEHVPSCASSTAKTP